MITVACLTSLVALNGKNHAGTGIPQLFTFTQPLKRAQDDAFGPPSAFGLAGCSREVRGRVVDLHTIPYALVLTAARRDD